MSMLLLTGSAVGAHAIVVSASPAMNATVATGDLDVRIQFNSEIDRKRSRLLLEAPDTTLTSIELAPDSRPNYGRLRVDTPTLRRNYAQLLFSSKRSIRSMDHFSEVEEYFDGDTTLLAALGGRTLQKSNTNHMADFNAILDFPPAPKLDALNRLIASKSTPQELRGEKLFNGKAQCSACHIASLQFTDNSMHDLKVERFYKGRAEGPIKTFSLRGIKDSPPYLHDGRLLTLEDVVEFFNIVLEDNLTADEKSDLVQYLRVL